MASWKRKTGFYGDSEVRLFKSAKVELLTSMILGSDPVEALRILAEILLNAGENDARLRALLANNEVNAHWRRYGSNHVSHHIHRTDHEYAERLNRIRAGLH